MKSTSKILKALFGDVILAFSLVAILPVSALAQTVSFSPATNFAVGTDPRTLAIGDLNGDGKLDLAVANYGGCNYSCGSISILLGDGTGTFGGPTDVAVVGSGATFVAVGDLNGDGKLDLAVTTSTPDGVSILLGDGTGSFGAATNFAVGLGPTSVAIGDLNGDGKPDLATANQGDGVSILLGTGTGAFGPPTNFAPGTQPFRVAIGDLNGDGKPDLAVANHISSYVSILLGTGTGSFGSATNFGVGSGPTSVAIGDFNADGKPDLASANYYGNNASILLGNGTGSFGPTTNFGVGSNPYSVAIGDLNGDGKADLAVANINSSNVSILLGTGTGSFDPATNFAAGTAHPIFVAIGDLNGDGKPDLATGNYISPNVSILLNTTVFPQPPVASTGPDKTVIVGEIVTFDGSGSYDPDGTIASFGWNFGDTTTDSGAVVTKAYSTAGVYSVVLTVTDNMGASSSDTATVTVLTAGQAIQSLASIVQSFNLQQGITNSLDSKIQNALDAMTAANAGARSDAANKLSAFINSVEAQRGKQLTNAQADTLEALARRILAVI